MFLLYRSFISKRKKVIRMRWKIVKTSKNEKLSQGKGPTGDKILKLSINKKRWNHYPIHLRKYESSKSTFKNTMVIWKIWTTTQKFTGCEVFAIILVLGQKTQKTFTFPELSHMSWPGTAKSFLACNKETCLISSMRLKF